MSTVAVELGAWLETRRLDVEAALERWIPATGREPAVVWDAMRYSLLAGGKRLRPVLALAAAEAVAQRGGTDLAQARAHALPVACALELIHTYSLVHDDLPAMDNDVLRRGRPTAHVVYGEGLAILVGDALLTEAFALLAREPGEQPGGTGERAARQLRAIALIAEAAGASGMVGGQALDLGAASGATPLDAATLADMHARKTGALIRASVLAGATVARASDDALAAIGTYGSEVGLAFQIVDDILDIEGASADLGKTAGKDAAAGKPTYPALHGLEGSRRAAAACVERATHALTGAGLGGHLPALAHWVIGRDR
ncbi:MAG TPA: farnesyl diphosphate synthase [Vicinamibacterales bacterium]|nr:farnesyl diphosphate synthase [Vicinamibacterales bacterium]